MTNEMKLALISGGAAVIGGLVTGFFRWAVDRFNRPRLTIDYEGGDANLVHVDYQSGNTNIANIYIRARVRNQGRRMARRCRVFLTGLEEVHPSGQTTQTSYRDSIALPWAGDQFGTRDVPRGVEFYVDILWVSKHDPGWRFLVETLFANYIGLQNYGGTYRFHLLVTADDADPGTCAVDVTYSGNWLNLRAAQAP